MKRFIFFMILILITSSVYAVGPFKFGVLGGGWSASNSLYKNAGTLGGVISMDLLKYLSVEISGFSNNFDVSSSETGLSQGKISRTIILFGVKGQLPVAKGNIIPYLVVGAGTASPKYKIAPQVTSPWENVGFSIEENVKGKAVAQIGGGIDFRVIKMFALGIDARYIVAKADGRWSHKDIRSGLTFSGEFNNLDFGGVLLGVALKVII